MSSKKTKSLLSWWKCETCNAIINQKDSVLHKEKSCPPNLNFWIHSFILENSLYSTLEVFDLQEKSLRLIPKENVNDLILVPCHALQLCKIPIGDPVAIKPNDTANSTPFIKLVWPFDGKTGFSVALSNEALELNLLSSGSQIMISRIQEEIPIANYITLSCENECHLEEECIKLRIKKDNVNKILCVGNRLLLRQYGKKYIFKVIDILPYKSADELTEKSDEKCFYLLAPGSNIVLNNKNLGERQDSVPKLGGLDDIIGELKDTIYFILKKQFILPDLNVAKGILIYGPNGCGKSTLIQFLAKQFPVSVIKIDCTKIFSNILGETEKELHLLFNKAIQMCPSIILIDDIDLLCTKLTSSSGYDKRISGTLVLLMDTLNKNNSAVAVLATTSKINNIDIMLRSSTRFGKEVEICVPNSSQRFDILSLLLLDLSHNLTEPEVKSLADSLHGFVGSDIASLVSNALFKNYKSTQGKENVSINDFIWALSKTKPSAMKEILVEIPSVKWEDIGGQENLKLKLKQSIEWPLKYKESFSRLGITPPKGLLMFGPPGCSKTMIAKALATESNLNFISVKGPELFNKWVGESERAVRKLFRRARQAAPSIIFFDEIDAIGGERNTSMGSNVQERVLAQLLIELDGIESLENVTVIAATNRPDRIDPALLRPGRLDRIIYVPLPDYKTRKEIIELQLKKSCVSKDVIASELAEKTEGYSGAEIVAVCREAALKALEENFEAEEVTRMHFLAALEIVFPRTSKNLLDLYEKYLQNKIL